jgi:putative ABC transport system permease protein
MGVLREGALLAVGGLIAGGIGGYALMKLASSYLGELRTPDAVPIAGAVVVLLAAAVAASLLPAARAARVDIVRALRAD